MERGWSLERKSQVTRGAPLVLVRRVKKKLWFLGFLWFRVFCAFPLFCKIAPPFLRVLKAIGKMLFGPQN